MQNNTNTNTVLKHTLAFKNYIKHVFFSYNPGYGYPPHHYPPPPYPPGYEEHVETLVTLGKVALILFIIFAIFAILYIIMEVVIKIVSLFRVRVVL